MRAIVMSITPGPVVGHPDAFRDALLAATTDPRWGLHGRPNGATPEDIIAFNVPALGKPYQIFDIAAGSKGDSPQRSWQDQTPTMEDGSQFIAVRQGGGPLSRLRVEGTRFVRADGRPFQWRGATAFDLPLRIADGDPAFADFLAAEGFTIARIVPASVYRTPRTLDQGIAHLPDCLDALASRGLYAEVVILVDTGEDDPNYDLSRDEMRAYVSAIGSICAQHQNVGAIELSNEPYHGTQNPALMATDFARELRALLPADIPVSWGSTGLEDATLTGGDYITIHSDRGKSPDENGADLADLQQREGKPVIDDEPLGVADVPKGQRTTDPAYGAELGAALVTHRLGGSTFHLEAGLTASVAVLGPIQRDAARRFIAAAAARTA